MSFARLQQQADAYSGFAERGQEQIQNFDTDKLMAEGQATAYKQGHAQMERMLGQEVYQGLREGLPPLVRTGRALAQRARGMPTTAAEAQRRMISRRANQAPGRDENLPQGQPEPPAAPSYEEALRSAGDTDGVGSQARAAAERIRRPGGAPDQEGDLEPMGDDGAGNRIRNTAPEPTEEEAANDLENLGEEDPLKNFTSRPQPDPGDIARPTRDVPEPPGTEPTDAYDSQGRSRPPPERPTRDVPDAPGDEGEDTFDRQQPQQQEQPQRPTRDVPEAPGEEGEAAEDATANITKPSAEDAQKLADFDQEEKAPTPPTKPDTPSGDDKPPAYDGDDKPPSYDDDGEEGLKDVDKGLDDVDNIEKVEGALAPEEAVADAIPGVGELLGGLLAIGGAIFGAVESSKSDDTPAPKQPQGPVAAQIAFSSAPVIDSDDYHNA
tara:strand:- start:4514 stop:5827 length:1314 start_codon:yes stop_codon:yes gene_type:complete